MFTVTAIQPQNIYRKILSQCNDKTLDRNTCNILNAYYVVKKHGLFDCKTGITIRLQPQLKIQKKSQDILLKLKLQLRDMEHYLGTLQKTNTKTTPETAKKPMSEI